MRRCVALPALLGALLLTPGAYALIAGRDAEALAAQHEKAGKWREAAVWRLVAARSFAELVIPFERENVRAYTFAGSPDLAKTCAARAEVQYPAKVTENRRLFAAALAQAGGEAARPGVEAEARGYLCQMAPIPTAIPSRLRTVEQKEEQADWATAGNYREMAARLYLLVTAPFFARESWLAPDAATRTLFHDEGRRYLAKAQSEFERAAANYRRAADKAAAADAERCRRLAAATDDEAKAVAVLLAAGGPPPPAKTEP